MNPPLNETWWQFYCRVRCEGVRKCDRQAIYLVHGEDDLYIPLCRFHFIRQHRDAKDVAAVRFGTMIPTASDR